MQFQVGSTYQTRSICDHDCIISATIIRRTEKTVVAMVENQQKTFRIAVYEGVENFKPFGSYSMAPILSADKVAK